MPLNRESVPGTRSARPTVLVVRQVVRAPAERVFEAWTEPTQLLQWWGPSGVTCTRAEIDLRVGGRYRIANRFADGRVVWIEGEFEAVEPPHRLVYTWRIDSQSDHQERVTVRFERRAMDTEVIVSHEWIRDAAAWDRHEAGWRGCLVGLANYLSEPWVSDRTGCPE